MPERSAPRLVAYPALWQQSLDQHPHDWKAQFRTLCRLAGDFRRDHRATYVRLPAGERMFLEALDRCDPEDLIVSMIAWADPSEKTNPLQRYDPFVGEPSDASPAATPLNGHKVLDA
jgi:hypothetical protein